MANNDVDWHRWAEDLDDLLKPGTQTMAVTPTGETAIGMTELEEVTITGVPGTFWREL